jgi:hypothetical protein
MISTFTGPGDPAGHSKHIRHWSLIRMLYWPLRSPFSGFKAVAGQRRKILECRGRFQTVKLQAGGPLNAGKGFDPFAGSKVEGTPVPIADDHL